MADQGLHLGIEQRLQQGLSPMQLRYGRLLEMSGPELDDEVQRELDDNPALEPDDGSAEAPSRPEDPGEFNETAEQLQRADYASEDDIPSYCLQTNNYSADDDDRPDLQIADGGETLMDSLLMQIGELQLSPHDAAVARYIVGTLDDSGYLTRAVADMANDLSIAAGIDVTEDDVRRVLREVRTLEPPGVGAVDLRDSLLLQLKALRREDAAGTLAKEIVGDYFDLFSKLHLDRLAQELHCSRAEVEAAVEVIKSLNPKPGSAVGAADARAVVPDFSVTRDAGGALQLTLLSARHDLRIASSFTLDGPAAMDPFVKRKREEGTQFISLLEMRAATLMRVMGAIVRLQEAFFTTGERSDLRPMALRDIAEITGDDLSVISRATLGKYVATEWGVIPLKYFFNERLHDADGEEVSQHRVIEALKKLIDEEDKSRPLSDEAITQRLTADGYDIARRTVAKYRERMGLPVARLRKR